MKFGYFWGNSLVRFCSIIIVILLSFTVIHGVVSITSLNEGCVTDSECEDIYTLSKEECATLEPFTSPNTVPEEYTLHKGD